MTTNQSSSPEKEASRLTRLWQKFGPNTYPLDIERLINEAIITSGFRDELEVRRNIFDSFEGCLIRSKGTKKWSILLNDNTGNKRRQRFTFAHELGHFMCHRYLQDRFEDDEKSLNNFMGGVEQEANVFAAQLLMPANILRDEFSGKPWTAEVLREVGSRFECSLQASGIRFVTLSAKPCAFVVSRDGVIVWSCKSKTAPYLAAFTFGHELPAQSQAAMPPENEAVLTEAVQSGFSWSEKQCCKESQYFDYSGLGYQYTCIEFTG